jgi:hypothetical protein
MESTRDRFVINMRTGLSIRPALAKALLEALIQIEQEKSESMLTTVLNSLGLTDLSGKALTEVRSILNRRVDGLLYVVPTPGAPTSIPTPECIDANLPKDRPITEEDIRKAWDKCIITTSR